MVKRKAKTSKGEALAVAFTGSESPVESLEAALGYTFRDRVLLLTALTHRSYVHETPGVPNVTNERLEFLGDSVLAFITAEHLYRTHPLFSEGDLTNMRAALVKAPTLASFARSIGLGAHLRLGRGEEANRGREREPILAATLEAVIGALWLEAGIAATQRFVLGLIAPEAERLVTGGSFKDDKSLFQEMAQARLGHTPVYRIVTEAGPSHRRIYTVEVAVGDLVIARGEGKSKRRAEQAAAHQALTQEGWRSEESIGL